MKRLPLILLPLLAACQTDPSIHAPVEHVVYQAIGRDPFWTLAIGDDRIVLTLPPPPGAEAARMNVVTFPRTLPRTIDGVRRWETGSGTSVLTIEARPGPCRWAGGVEMEDRVVARLSGRELSGCGGRPVGEHR